MFGSCMCIEPNGVGRILNCDDVTARIQHVCGECCEVIRVSEKYVREKLLFDSSITTHKTCLTCWRIRTNLFSCGWYYGEIWNAIHETYCDRDTCICPDKTVAAVQAVGGDY